MSGRNIGLNRLTLFLIVLSFMLSSCALTAGQKTTPTVEWTSTASVTPPPAAPRVITICLGEEPNTLFPFANPNDAAQSVLAALPQPDGSMLSMPLIFLLLLNS